MIPAWKERQLRIDETEPLHHMSYAHAMDVLQRTHKRLDSVRYQLWSSMKEVEQLMARLEAGNPMQPKQTKKSKSKAWHPVRLFSRKEK